MNTTKHDETEITFS